MSVVKIKIENIFKKRKQCRNKVQKMSILFDRWFQHFDCHAMYAFSMEFLWVPVAFAIFYLSVVCVGPSLLRHKKWSVRMQQMLKWGFTMWNLLMSMFSFCGVMVSINYPFHTPLDHVVRSALFLL